MNKFYKTRDFRFHIGMMIFCAVIWPAMFFGLMYPNRNKAAISSTQSLIICIIGSIALSVIFVLFVFMQLKQAEQNYQNAIRYIIKTDQGYFIGVFNDKGQVSPERYDAKLLDKNQLKLYLEMFELAYYNVKIEIEEIAMEELKQWKK